MSNRPLEIKYQGRKIRSLVGIKEAISELPRRLRGKALEVGAKYLVKRYKLYPRYKEVARAWAYPEVDGFFSDKQRRFVMAGIRNGTIRPGASHRTQSLKNDWRIVGRGVALSIVNDNAAAVFAYHPLYQARQLEMVGWRDIDIMTDENLDDALLEVEIYIYNEMGNELDRGVK